MSDDITVNIPQQSKHNDLIATMIGIGQAMAVSAMNYIAHLTETGGITYNASFWIGVVIAMLAGLQGYYSNRGGNQSQVVTNQSGTNATVNVSSGPETPTVQQTP